MATPERDAEKLLRSLREEMADPQAAMCPATDECLRDEQVVALGGDDPLTEDLARVLAEHLPACARCRALLAMVLDETPAPEWAKQATREATRAWREGTAHERTSVLQLLLAWLPGAPAPQPALVGVFAARPEPATLDVSEDVGELALRVGTRATVAGGVEVLLRDRASGEPVASATTDANGIATFADVARGTYEITVEDYGGPLKICSMD